LTRYISRCIIMLESSEAWMAMEREIGVYVISVVSRLLGLHPQTLRKYERAGFLRPSRSGMLRLYSDEDLARLRVIKYLVDELGLNLAGVKLALALRAELLELEQEVALANIDRQSERRLRGFIREMLEMLGS